MSTLSKKEQHLRLAKSNHRLATALSEFPTHCDWVATACFYAAIHYLQYDINPSETIEHHQQRERIIRKKYDKTSNTWINYRKLKDRSLNARYIPNIASAMSGDKKLAKGTLQLLEDLKKELNI